MFPRPVCQCMQLTFHKAHPLKTLYIGLRLVNHCKISQHFYMSWIFYLLIRSSSIFLFSYKPVYLYLDFVMVFIVLIGLLQICISLPIFLSKSGVNALAGVFLYLYYTMSDLFPVFSLPCLLSTILHCLQTF